jgi:hypothetical protein
MTLDETNMLLTFDVSWMLNFWSLMPYFLIGFGFGIAFYYMFYDKNSMTELDRKKHDLEVKKEWLRMLATQKNKSKRFQ